MVVRILVPVLVALVTSGSAGAEDSAPLACTGAFAKTADEAALVQRFGRENVAAATLEGAEGATERGTVVYPKDPRRRIEIAWHDPKRRRRPASITLKGLSGWAVAVPGGALARIAGGCSLSLRFDPDPKARAGALDKVSGEGEFASTDAAMKAVRPRASEIALGWPE